MTVPKLNWVDCVLIGVLGCLAATTYDSLWIPWYVKVIVYVSGAVLLGVRTRSRANRELARKIAGEMYNQWKRYYLEPHQYQSVEPSNLEAVERDYFEASQQPFEQLGFRHIGDLVNLTVEVDYPKERRINRILLNEPGTMRVTIDQHVRIEDDGTARTSWPRTVINSELSNDRFVTTIRQEHTAVDRKDCRKPVPGLGIDYHYVGLETSAEDLLRLHQEHIRQALSRAPQEQLLSFATFDEVRQSVSRMQSLLNRYAQPRLDRRTVIDRIQAAHPARSTTWCEEVYRQFELLRSCRQCGYDLLGNSGNICPECGAAVTAVVKTKVNEA